MNKINDEELKVLFEPYSNYIFEKALYDKNRCIDGGVGFLARGDMEHLMKDELFLYVRLRFNIKKDVSIFMDFYKNMLSYRNREEDKHSVHHFNVQRTLSKYYIDVILIFKKRNYGH